jgi:P27 family predicted phage terminase small subunit
MRGRKPKPALLHVLHGNPNDRGAAKLADTLRAEPTAPPVGLDVPSDLSASQRSIWNEILDCAPAGVLGQIDRDLLRAFVIACDTHRKANADLAKRGLFILKAQWGDKEEWAVNPAQDVCNKQALLIAKLGAELGFSPVARARIGKAIVENAPDATQRLVKRAAGASPASLDAFLAAAPERPHVN